MQSCHKQQKLMRKAGEPYLDGLGGLAFHLVRHGGRLIHDGTPTVRLPTETFHPRAAACCRTRSLLFDVMCGSERATASDSCSVQCVAGSVRGRRVHGGRVMRDQGRPQEFRTPRGGGRRQTASVPIHGEADLTRTRAQARTLPVSKVFQSHTKLIFFFYPKRAHS